ncbi:uncharacterized protein BJ171DRAFT_485003 [Polychytrium aggregatum]|uniref:uncharacterized protein n=1 Tax=Polychytrium aggregatum TaxID=110093 RepID=UPI0022FE4A8E|nr:uncharacterized protein BJ171DRAFT_485003 [Polychytrium aggregatum]KAI9209779.1 hypothetical protein BJ171DRAFT_485003 [Polychytrium aggregatum]
MASLPSAPSPSSGFSLNGALQKSSDFLVSKGLPPLGRLGTSPYPPAATFFLGLAGALNCLRNPVGWPGYVPLVATSAIFGASSLILLEDSDHGSSIVTAWSVAYAAAFLPKAIQSRRPGPIGFAAFIIANAVPYASEAYDAFLA